ncbi:MAG: hypothetical protein FJ224_05500 [Lentisphaerae bacterium]|nr:hypothetical protein [Lentisphaerota bacterium]
MNRGGSPGHICLFLLAVAIAALPSFSSSAESVPRAAAGFNGFVKPERWFPVRISGAPAPCAYEVLVMSRGWGGGEPTPSFHGAGVMDESGQVLLCKLDDDSGEPFVECRFASRDGKPVIARCTLKSLSERDVLALVVSASPHSFDFLGSIQLPGRGVVCAVPLPPAEIPRRWQEMDGVDMVLLDVPPAGLDGERLDALRSWIVAGGTAVLTPEAFAGPVTAGAEWLTGGKHGAVAGADAVSLAAPLFGEYAAHVVSAPALGFEAPPVERLLGDGVRAVLAARDVGAGRIVSVGVDWRAVEMRDRMFIEGARHSIWSKVIALNRASEPEYPNKELVTPEEAKAKFLTRYIAVFLGVYVLLLGPVNWLVLRRLKRLEYSIVTIPAGSLAFAVLAFMLGLSLRSDRTLLREAEAVLVNGADRGLLLGTAGVMSPDREPYSLSLPGTDAIVTPEAGRSWMPQAERLRDMPVYDSRDPFSVSNIKIGMWSIRYFNTRGIVRLGGMMESDLSLGAAGITGVITNATGLTVSDAVLFHRWNRVAVGTLKPGDSREVLLPLAPASRKVFGGKCPNCGRYHGGARSLTEKYCREHPLPDGMREFAADLDLDTAAPVPILAGWLEAPGTSIDAGRADCDAGGKRLGLFLLPVTLSGPEMTVAEGFVEASAAMRGESVEAAFVHDVRSDFFADRKKTDDYDPYAAYAGQDRGDGASDPAELVFFPHSRNRAPAVSEFKLPFRFADAETSRIRIHWDAGEDDGEKQPVKVITALDWKAGAWTDIFTAAGGEHSVDVPDPGRFLRLPDCVMAFRTLVETNRLRSTSDGYFEVEWAGRAGVDAR